MHGLVKVFVGHSGLWSALRNCRKWKRTLATQQRIRRLSLADEHRTHWLFLEFELGSTLRADDVRTAVSDVTPDCLYYHKWSNESGGGGKHFGQALGYGLSPVALGFSGRDPDPVYNRGYYLLSAFRARHAFREPVSESSSPDLLVQRLPCAGDGADIAVFRIAQMREAMGTAAKGLPLDMLLLAKALEDATLQFVSRNHLDDDPTPIEQSKRIKSLLDSGDPPPDRRSRLRDLLDDLERIIVVKATDSARAELKNP